MPPASAVALRAFGVTLVVRVRPLPPPLSPHSLARPHIDFVKLVSQGTTRLHEDQEAAAVDVVAAVSRSRSWQIPPSLPLSLARTHTQTHREREPSVLLQ